MPRKKIQPIDIDAVAICSEQLKHLPQDDIEFDWISLVAEDNVSTRWMCHPVTCEFCKQHPEMSNYYVGVLTGKVYQRNIKTKQLRNNPVSLWAHKEKQGRYCKYTTKILMSLNESDTNRNRTVDYIQFVADTFYNKPAEETHYMRKHLVYRLVLIRTARIRNINQCLPYCPPEILEYSNRSDEMIFDVPKDDIARREKIIKYYNGFQLLKCQSQEKIEIEEPDDDEPHTLTLANGNVIPLRSL